MRRKMMFCPKCKSEFIDGITKCPDCGLDLEETLPSEEFVEFVKVFESSDPMLTALIKSILDEAEIKYFVTGEYMQSILGAKFSFASNADIGNAEFLVSKENEELVRELIRNAEEYKECQ